MTPDELTTLVQAGGLTHQQAIHFYAALYGHSPDAPALALPCEQCGRLTQLAVMVSYKVWVAMPGHPAVAGFDEHDQHFCCSHDCAEKSVANCIAFHLRPEAERRCAAAAESTESQE